MNEARCEKTDLLESQCSHCRGMDSLPTPRVITRFEAKYHSRCSLCDAAIERGDSAAYDADNDVICHDCAA